MYGSKFLNTILHLNLWWFLRSLRGVFVCSYENYREFSLFLFRMAKTAAIIYRGNVFTKITLRNSKKYK